MISLALLAIGMMVATACGNYVQQGNLKSAAVSGLVAIGIFVISGASMIVDAIREKR